MDDVLRGMAHYLTDDVNDLTDEERATEHADAMGVLRTAAKNYLFGGVYGAVRTEGLGTSPKQLASGYAKEALAHVRNADYDKVPEPGDKYDEDQLYDDYRALFDTRFAVRDGKTTIPFALHEREVIYGALSDFAILREVAGELDADELLVGKKGQEIIESAYLIIEQLAELHGLRNAIDKGEIESQAIETKPLS